MEMHDTKLGQWRKQFSKKKAVDSDENGQNGVSGT